MVIVRDVFQIDPEHMKEAKEWARENREMSKRAGFGSATRILTDLVGNYYTLVLEHEFQSLTEFENGLQKFMSNPEWQQSYTKMRKAVWGGHREVLSLVD